VRPDIIRGDDRSNALQPKRSRDIESGDARMRGRTAEDGGM
jgi:hypothetical protein